MHDLWLKAHRSIFSLTFEGAEGRLSSGTGFKVGRFLVTNNHVVQIPSATRVTLRSVVEDGHSTAFELKFDHLHFRSMFMEGDPETAWDYAVYAIDSAQFAAAPALGLLSNDDVKIGAQVALFGFQFEQAHLSMHQGVVSSQFHRAGVHYLQLDSSVNQGNSGGPLIDAQTGKVFGVVTRKATGLTRQFDELIGSFRQNVALLRASQQSGSYVRVGAIDSVSAALVAQTQMERIAKEIARSANVGIGYAYHISRVRECLSRLAESSAA